MDGGVKSDWAGGDAHYRSHALFVDGAVLGSEVACEGYDGILSPLALDATPMIVFP